MADSAAAPKPETDNAGAIAPKAGGAAPPKKPAQPPAADAGRPWPDKPEGDVGANAKPLSEDRCRLLEFVDPGFHVTLEHGTPYEKVFDPTFWANVVRPKRMQPGHRIRVTNDEMSFYAWLVVFSVGPNWAQVAQETYVKRDEMHRGSLPDKYRAIHKVEWNGPIKKYRIVRVSDQSEMRSGFDSEAEANRYLDDYLRRVSR